MVKSGEQRALETLVELFDWLGGVGPQSTTEYYGRDHRPSRSADPKTLNGKVQEGLWKVKRAFVG